MKKTGNVAYNLAVDFGTMSMLDGVVMNSADRNILRGQTRNYVFDLAK